MCFAQIVFRLKRNQLTESESDGSQKFNLSFLFSASLQNFLDENKRDRSVSLSIDSGLAHLLMLARRWLHIRPQLVALPAFCEGGDGADGWEDERRDKKAPGKILREWGTARVSAVRRVNKHPNLSVACWLCHPIGAEKCRPVVSLARAGPSRPGRCWSTTQRSYLMTTVPPLEALYSLPLPEVRIASRLLLHMSSPFLRVVFALSSL